MSKARFVFRTMVMAMAGMVLVYLGVGQILANEWHIETVRVLRASPDEVARFVGDLDTWSKWSSTDANLGPQTARAVVGEPGKVGNAITWTGPHGTARLQLAAVGSDSVDYEFVGQGAHDAEPRLRSRGRIVWSAEAGGCRVCWRDEGSWDSTVGRWFGWFGALQERLREVQGASLAGLQQAIEGARAAGK
ncbi:MAG TPA: SRPBCC family protein [Planctomycetota bacterium]|nr:SRPBCC family protein [Planctomycetota bacterium]